MQKETDLTNSEKMTIEMLSSYRKLLANYGVDPASINKQTKRVWAAVKEEGVGAAIRVVELLENVGQE